MVIYTRRVLMSKRDTKINKISDSSSLSNGDHLDFEEKVAHLDRQMKELRKLSSTKGIDYSAEIRKLQRQQVEELKTIYSNLTAWQTVQVARHPNRPLLSDYLSVMVKDFHELHGDRCFGDDRAIVTGLGQIGREKVLVVGQNKGKTTKQKIACNCGCPNPEGYRKALAKMKFAEKFGIPIVTLIDTPGAYPGVGAEERGQAQAIAVNLNRMPRLKVPIICIVIGEGGSGGALGIGVGDRLYVLEYAYYSVISPEGCAAILWKERSKAPEAAETLKLTGEDLLELGIVDDIIKEPLGGAHRDSQEMAQSIKAIIKRDLDILRDIDKDKLIKQRCEKFRKIGVFNEKKHE